MVSTEINDLPKIVLFFTTSKTTNSITSSVSFNQTLEILCSELKIDTALDNGEKVLFVSIFMSFNTSVKPSEKFLIFILHTKSLPHSSFFSLSNSVSFSCSLDNVIQLHHYISSNLVLDSHGILRLQLHFTRVVWWIESNSFLFIYMVSLFCIVLYLSNLAHFRQGNHLETTAISQDIILPSSELMKSFIKLFISSYKETYLRIAPRCLQWAYKLNGKCYQGEFCSQYLPFLEQSDLKSL